MYAIVTRRKMNAPRQQETLDRAQSEAFPMMRQAPGFVSFTLVRGEDGVNTALILFESQAQADAFQQSGQAWQRTLDEFGHQIEVRDSGEVAQHFTAQG